jgi:hypothetical protein
MTEGVVVSSRARALLVALLFFISFVGLAVYPESRSEAATCTKTWDGEAGTDFWENATNWNPNGVPGPTDTVCIPTGSGSVILNSVSSIVSLDAPGTSDSLTITSLGSLTITGTADSEIWLNVFNDGAFAVTNTGTVTIRGGGNGSGTFESSQPDKLRFVGDEYTLENGAQLKGGVMIGLPDGIPPGAGECPDDAPTGCPEVGFLSVAAGDVATASGTNTLYSSVLQGAGTLRITGTFKWTSDPYGVAVMRGTGTTRTTATGQLLINGVFGPPGNGTYGCGPYLCGGVNLQGGRTIRNDGTTIIRNAGFIAADDGTRFINNGLFQIENDRGYYQGVLIPNKPSSRFENNGVVRKTQGTGSSVIDADYSGAGDVDVLSGKLEVWGNSLKGDVARNKVLATGTTLEDSGLLQLTHRSYASSVKNLGSKTKFKLADVKPTFALPRGYKKVAEKQTRVSSAKARRATVTLQVDKKDLPASFDVDRVQVTDKGRLIFDCDGPSPRSCVLDRKKVQGDLFVTVRTADLSSSTSRVAARGGGVRGAALRVVFPTTAAVTVGGSFSSSRVSLAQGGSVRFYLGSDGSHRVKDKRGLADGGKALCDTGKASGGSYSCTFHAAGSYKLVDARTDARMKVRIPVRASKSGRSIVVTWTDSSFIPGCSSCKFLLSFRRKTSGGWQGWETWGTFSAGQYQSPHGIKRGSRAYQFRAKLVNGGRHTGWSPKAKVST